MNKMENGLKNKVIIIGADHHNTLAVIRCFGIQKWDFEILVITEHRDIVGVSHSKYAKNRFESVTPDEKEVINWLLHKAVTLKEKAIIVPCSDLAAYVIDKHTDDLKPYYILPGFQDQPGRVAVLMDKFKQKELAEEYQIPTADTWTIDVAEGDNIAIAFPCIIKPEISAKGNKADIAVCRNFDEFHRTMNRLKSLGYRRVLAQKLLVKKYEICAFGEIASGKRTAGTIVKKHRETAPPAQGSTLLAEFINNTQIANSVKSVIDMLIKEGYRGLYDIEMLVCADDIYLNEINFRSSGCGFGMIGKNEAFPCEWVRSELDSKHKTELIIPESGFIQNELADLFSRQKNHISLKTWFRDFIRSTRHAFFSLKDLSGTWFYYKRLLKRN